MKKAVICLLMLLFSTQVMAAMTGAYAMFGRANASMNEQPAMHCLSEPAADCQTVHDATDDSQARCAMEEMSDYVPVGVPDKPVKRFAYSTAAIDPLYTSIDLPGVIPPPRA